MTAAPPPVALTIAGSDSGGGAGIQADLKSFAALGVFGTTAITSITAQNTEGVHAVRDLPPDTVRAQITAVLEDLKPSAIKSGMLSNGAIIEAVAEELRRCSTVAYVLDPVMVSESGHALLEPNAVDSLITSLLPLALIATPNRHEAEVLTGVQIVSEDDMVKAARRIAELGPRYVLVKGGHMEGAEATDILFHDGAVERFSTERIPTRNTHGTGCTYSAAIAASLARGHAVSNAVQAAKDYVTGAIRHGFDLGAGAGPLHHFWMNSGGSGP